MASQTVKYFESYHQLNTNHLNNVSLLIFQCVQINFIVPLEISVYTTNVLSWRYYFHVVHRLFSYIKHWITYGSNKIYNIHLWSDTLAGTPRQTRTTPTHQLRTSWTNRYDFVVSFCNIHAKTGPFLSDYVYFYVQSMMYKLKKKMMPSPILHYSYEEGLWLACVLYLIQQCTFYIIEASTVNNSNINRSV